MVSDIRHSPCPQTHLTLQESAVPKGHQKPNQRFLSVSLKINVGRAPWGPGQALPPTRAGLWVPGRPAETWAPAAEGRTGVSCRKPYVRPSPQRPPKGHRSGRHPPLGQPLLGWLGVYVCIFFVFYAEKWFGKDGT